MKAWINILTKPATTTSTTATIIEATFNPPTVKGHPVNPLPRLKRNADSKSSQIITLYLKTSEQSTNPAMNSKPESGASGDTYGAPNQIYEAPNKPTNSATGSAFVPPENTSTSP